MPAKKKDRKHYLEFYVGDYLRDTAHLSPTHHGVYMLLLFHYWQKGMLQASFEQCSRIAKASTPLELACLEEVLQEFFERQGDRYINGKMEETLVKFSSRKTKAHERAVKGATGRWGPARPESGDASSTPEALLTGCPPTPTPAVIQLPSHSAGSSTEGHDDRVGGFEGHSEEQVAAASGAAVAMVEAATRLRRAGVPDVSPSNAWLAAAFADGFTLQNLVDAAGIYTGKPLSYLVKALRNQRDEAATSSGATARRPEPPRAAGNSPKVEETPEHRVAAAVDWSKQQVELGYMTSDDAAAYVADVKAKWGVA